MVMRGWAISTMAVCILMFLLLSILLVQALPQVDLLDTAFHRNTAPVVVHSQAISFPDALNASGSVLALTHLPLENSMLSPSHRRSDPQAASRSGFYNTLRC
jgi:hypothetical protein